MLDTIFLQLYDMSKIASIVILAVLLVRLFLRRAPKVFSYALWGVVLFRLLCPISIEAPVSLIPKAEPTIQSYGLLNEPVSPLGALDAAQQAVGDALNGGIGVQHVQTSDIEEDGTHRVVYTDWGTVWILVTKFLWMGGMAVLILYSTLSLLRLKRHLIGAARLRDNIYLADHINSPFVIGLFRPRIYLPSSLSEKEQDYIILHEQYHIGRWDHVIKLLSFAALCLHCFNPLVWIAFILSGRDMEMSCDEAVLRKLGDHIRADYSASLLSLATGRRIIAGAPLAFGEGNTEGRIKNIAKWKKPALWITVAAIVICLITAICLITNPMNRNTMLLGAEYRIAETLYHTEEYPVFRDEDQHSLCITADYCLWARNPDSGEWKLEGQMHPYSLSKEELEQYTAYHKGWVRSYRIGEITDAYILRIEGETFHNFFLALQTETGDTLVGYGYEDVDERGQGASDDTCLYWLSRVKSVFRGSKVAGAFHERSLTRTVDGDVSIYHTWVSKNYTVVGFKSDNEPYTEGIIIPEHKTDMGFAVFYQDKNHTGFRLLDCYVYKDAALAENGVFFCDTPAVLDLYGNMDNNNSYDIILLNNDKIAKAVREWQYPNGNTKKYSKTMLSGSEMVLIPRRNLTNDCRVWQYFLDENDKMIDTRLVSTEHDFPPSPPVYSWLDLEPTSPKYDWDQNKIAVQPEFPDTVFRLTSEEITAEVNGESTLLISGMPIWNAYFTDLNKDGYPEICATVSWGSGIVDCHVVVYDYKNGTSSTLWERMKFDYTLSLENGLLFCSKSPYGTSDAEEKGVLAMENGNLVILPYVTPFETGIRPTTADVTGAFESFLFIPMEGGTYRFEQTSEDPAAYQKNVLIDSFTEKELGSKTDWRVYTVKESPDKTVLLAEADWETTSGVEHSVYIYQYSPPKGVSPNVLEAAKAAGMTVLEDGFVTEGKHQWNEFYHAVQKGKSSKISIAMYYTLTQGAYNTLFTDYYEAHKEDYPALYLFDLIYDGEKFILMQKENGEIIRREYKYLKEFVTTLPSPSSSKIPGKAVRYVLLNDQNASWDDLVKGLASSQLGDYIDHYIIYSKKQ